MKKLQFIVVVLVLLMLMGCTLTPKEYQLVVTTTGSGTVVISPDRAIYQEGTVVTVEAKPATGYVFSNWVGGGFDNQTNSILTITMNSDITLKAVFEMKKVDTTTYTSETRVVRSNNSAVMKTDGFNLGRALEDVAQLRKEVPYTVQTPNPAFQLGGVYLTRNAADRETIYMVVPVTNVSSENYGFIELTGIRYKDETGAVLGEESLTFVYASVGDAGYDIYTDTCLMPGETGYFISIETEINYSQVESVEFTTVQSDTQVTPALGKFLPQKIIYTQQENTLYDDVSVQFGNEGTQKILIDAYNTPLYILLDENDLPLLWNYARSFGETDVVLDGGQTLESIGDLFKYTGQATKILYIADYTDYSDPTVTSQAVVGKPNLSAEERWKLRNQRVMATQERAGY